MKSISRRVCLSLLAAFLFSANGFSQNNALVMNGASIVMNGGTITAPIYLVVNQSNTSGITYSGGSMIVSEGQYNFVQWECGTSTGPYVIPFGANVASANYSLPFTFEKTTAASSKLDISTWHTNQQNMPHPALSGTVAAVCCMTGVGDSVTSAIDRFWDIRTSAATTANLTFSYAGPENTTSVPTDPFKAQHWNGTYWDAAVGPGNTGVTGAVVGTVGSVTGQTTFSPWVLVNSNKLLPVELMRFAAECKGSDVLVEWSTATETNNDFFTVERSADGLNYLPLGTVNGAGNSTAMLNYFFADTDPFSGVGYYRLKQTDFNGSTQTFSSVSVPSCSGSGGVSVLIGNGINHGNVWVSIQNAGGQNVLVGITDVLGRNVYSRLLTHITDSYLLNAELLLAPGVYIVNAYTASENFSKKIVVVR